MSWQDQLRGDALSWLLETKTPEVRYLTLRDLLERLETDLELRAVCKAAHKKGPIAAVLAEMDKASYWVESGPGYNPKYRSTVWSVILLAQLGASAAEDKRIAQACAYLLDHALTAGGQFTTSGAPSGPSIVCRGIWPGLCLVGQRVRDGWVGLARRMGAGALRVPVRAITPKCSA